MNFNLRLFFAELEAVLGSDNDSGTIVNLLWDIVEENKNIAIATGDITYE